MLDSRYAIWIGWGPELTFLYNDAYRSMTLGKKHPWALGQPARVVWAEAWQDLSPRVDDVVQRGKATYDERLLLFLERSGYKEETYHTFSYSPVPDDQGNVGGLLCIVTEETERYIAERRLKVLRELAARVANTRSESDLYQAICECLAANQHDLPFSMLYIADPETQVAKLACSTVIHEGHPAAPAGLEIHRSDRAWPIHQVFERAQPVMLQGLAGRFDDLPTGAWDIAPHTALLTPISQQGQSQPAGVLIIGANPYRPMDDAYRGFIGLLAGQIAAGLADVRAYEEERKRAEALAEIDRAKTVFFSNVSHEFRTPLTLILTPLEGLLARESAARSLTASREEVELIHRNALRLLRLVNTLLDFSRIESGRVHASFEAVDLSTYTAELASSFRSAMERAGLKYVVECDPLPEPVYIDRDMWEKIVLNLLSNAFKYTLKGEVAISVKASPDRGHAVVTVRDTGTGIPSEELPRLFERFHRIEGQPGRTQEGTGIGLALVQELVRVHGGSVQVESEVGKGSVFSVSIPFGTRHLATDRIGSGSSMVPTSLRAQAFVEEAMRWLPGGAEAELTVDKDLASAPIEATPAQERELVLVVDDNSDMRDYIRRLLGLRYEVVTATNGLEALELIRQRRPALILSDVMMPRLDGLGLLREIRNDAELRDLPVILLSARAGEEASIEGLDSGADDYLIKPFSARELIARVQATLNLARRRREVADALREINETLEQRVAEEIAERMKAQEAIRQGQRMETIGQLTGGVAHDFNNLLQVISGNLYVLQQRLATNKFSREDLTNLTEGAIRGAKRAATLTQRLLAFSRRQPLDPKPVDVNRLVSGMSELLRRTLGESIAIETVLAGGLWRISVDASELENALLNLAVNARDAMRDGGRLTIETANSYIDESYAASSEELNPGQYVMIAVSDSGTGMTEEVIARAFEPFFTTKDAGQGTGLGLSHVYGFVKQSGGHVKIYSEQGEGTTVKVYLPRLLEEYAEKSTEPARPKLVRGAQSEIILVVEDDEDVRSNTVLMLRELGYGVVEAPDGRTALAILEREERIDLLFTDVGLPGGINGRVLSDKARELRPRLKVLFTSGYARNAIVHQGRLDPGVDLISKPFTFDQLAAKIRQVLKG
jgi:signal transduction histidine kinase